MMQKCAKFACADTLRSNIFDADMTIRYFQEEKIKRASILVLTFYRKIRTLTMVIR